MTTPETLILSHLGHKVILEPYSYFVNFRIYKIRNCGELHAHSNRTDSPSQDTVSDEPDIEGAVDHHDNSRWTVGGHKRYLITDTKQFDDLSDVMKICHSYAMNWFHQCDQEHRERYGIVQEDQSV
jgi:hypothetical protein